METTIADLLRIVFAVAFIAGFIWVLTQYPQPAADERFARLSRMLARVGVPMSEWEMSLYLPNAARACRDCKHKRECDAWLAQSGRASAPPAFCANAAAPRFVTALRWTRAE